MSNTTTNNDKTTKAKQTPKDVREIDDDAFMALLLGTTNVPNSEAGMTELLGDLK